MSTKKKSALATCVVISAVALTHTTHAQTDAERIAALEQKVEALTVEMQRNQFGDVFAAPTEGAHGLGASASKVYGIDQGISIGGYGEALYQNYDGDKAAQADFLRAIMYFGYKFTDKWVLNTEIEIEHANEAFLEFGYLDYLASDALNFRAGLLLIPMGHVNELHEPNAFLSARRSDVENRIIPTTWRENGIGIFGDTGDVSYKAYVVNGLDGKKFTAKGLRGGRQKGSKALAEDLAFVGRLDWEPTPGVVIGGSLYHGDSGQDLDIDITTDIIEGHFDLRRGPLQLRGLITQAELDDVAALNRTTATPADDGTAPADAAIDSVGEKMIGGYIEAGLDVSDWILNDSEASVTPFIRVEQYNTQDSAPAGFKTSAKHDVSVITTGLNIKPIDQIVFKLDYQMYDDDANSNTDQFNLAAGYVF